MSLFKLLISMVLSFIAALLIAVAILFLSPKLYASWFQNWFEANSQYELALGEVELDLFPLQFLSSDVVLKIPSTSKGEIVVGIDEIVVNADVMAYLSGANTWWGISGNKLDVLFNDRIDTDNKSTSLDSNASQSSKESSAQTKIDDRKLSTLFESPVFEFSHINFDQFELRRVNEKETIELIGSQFLIKNTGDNKIDFDFEANYSNQPVVAKGRISLPSAIQTLAVDLSLLISDSKLEINSLTKSDSRALSEIRFSAQSDDTLAISKLFNTDLSALTPLEVEGSLTSGDAKQWDFNTSGQLGGRLLDLVAVLNQQNQTITLSKMSAEIGDSQLNLNGTLNLRDKTLNASLDSNQLNLNELMGFASAQNGVSKESSPKSDIRLTPLRNWQVNINGQFKKTFFQNITIEETSFNFVNRADNASLESRFGEISVFNSTQPPIKADLSATNKDALKWKSITPIEAGLRLGYEKDAQANGWPLSVILKTEGVNAEINTLLMPSGKVIPKGTVQANIVNFSAVKGFDSSTWTKLLPITLQANANLGSQKVQLDPLTLTIQKSQVTGNIVADYGSEPLSISGKLNSPNIDLNNFPMTTAEQLKDLADEVDNTSTDVISDEELALNWLSLVDLNLSLSLDNFSFNQSTLYNFNTQLSLKDEKLKIDPIEANLSEGKMRGYLKANRADKSLGVDGRLLVTGLQPADLGKKNQGLIDGGTTDLLIDLKTRGNTPQQLASALSGEMAVEIQQATIRNNLFEIIGSDILLQTINMLNPFVKRDKTTELECAALYFKAEDGILTSPEQLVIETSKMKIRGGGKVNLKDETLEIDFVPTSREGVGINFSSLASVVRLGGTLGNPRPVANPSGIFKAGASIGAVLATGGLSLLGQNLFDRVRSAGTACGKIFDQVAENSTQEIN